MFEKGTQSFRQTEPAGQTKEEYLTKEYLTAASTPIRAIGLFPRGPIGKRSKILGNEANIKMLHSLREPIG